MTFAQENSILSLKSIALVNGYCDDVTLGEGFVVPYQIVFKHIMEIA